MFIIRGLIFQTFILFSEDVFVSSGAHCLEIAELVRKGSHIRWTEGSKAQRLVHFQG